MVFIGLIIKKHHRRQHEICCQEKLKRLLDCALEQESVKSEYYDYINQINESIKNNQLDLICAWSSIIQSSNESTRKKYLKIFLELNHIDLLSKALISKNTKEKCLAIQTVGLCKINAFDETLKSLTKIPVFSGYACIAIAKTQGILSIDTLIEAFKNELISTSQLLAALIEIQRKDLLSWQRKKTDNRVNQIIACYLEEA
jgi:hypothetical protein